MSDERVDDGIGERAGKPPERRQAGAVRAALSARMSADGLEPIVVTLAMPTVPVAPTIVQGSGDGVGPPQARIEAGTVDGQASTASLEWSTVDRARLTSGDGRANGRVDVILEPPRTRPDGRGATEREVLVGGWRIEVEVESERHAALRERARRAHDGPARGATSEVHAIIPGRVVSIAVQPGDSVSAGQQLLVVEAMKMQNEVRAPRDGTVTRIVVAPDDTIDAGDLLLVFR
jgi:biotin carboxyl carrier protein